MMNRAAYRGTAGRVREAVVLAGGFGTRLAHAVPGVCMSCTLFPDTGTSGTRCKLYSLPEREDGDMGQNPASKYTPEFRRETADYVISSGRPITECCRELGLNSKTVNKWVVERRRELAGEPGPKAPDPELRRLQKRVRELEMENEFLKKAAAFFARTQG